MGASPSGLAAGNCRPGQTLKTPKYLSACDRDEHGCEEGAGTEMILVVYYESNEVYYESIKREPKIRGIKKCRCDERLKLKQRNLRASHTLGWSWNWNT
jgi:hypothetical protein